MRILVYGGSFDPPHEGHIRSLRAAMEALRPGRTLIIPASVPPHKAQPPGGAEPAHRLRMTELAAGRIPGAQVLDMELCREGKSYTSDTMRQLKRLYPEDELIFLLGTDMLLSFFQWHEPEVILSLASIAYFPRQAEDGAAAQAQVNLMRERCGATVYEIPGRPLEVSSTELRELFGKRLGRGSVPEEVYAYIIQNRLYGARPELEWLRSRAYAYLDPQRVAHVRGTEQEAVRLARRWGAPEDAAAEAAICHDMTKKLTGREQLRLCRKYAIITEDPEKESEKLFHAKTGAALAGDVFGMPPEICSAIRWHTTGRPGMSLLERVIYLADYIEPGRKDFDGLKELRRAAYEDLDAAMELGMRMTICEVRGKGRESHGDTVRGQKYYLGLLRQKGKEPVRAEGIPDTI